MANLIKGEAGRKLLDTNAAAENGLDVWLVDDNAGFRAALKGLLNQDPGIRCSHDFSSGPLVLAALQLLAPPAVILLDVEMPGMSGLEALPAIKQLAPATAVMILTTFFDAERRRAALAAGAGDFLVKARPVSQLVAAIRAVNAQPPAAQMSLPVAKEAGLIQKLLSRFLP